MSVRAFEVCISWASVCGALTCGALVYSGWWVCGVVRVAVCCVLLCRVVDAACVVYLVCVAVCVFMCVGWFVLVVGGVVC